MVFISCNGGSHARPSVRSILHFSCLFMIVPFNHRFGTDGDLRCICFRQNLVGTRYRRCRIPNLLCQVGKSQTAFHRRFATCSPAGCTPCGSSPETTEILSKVTLVTTSTLLQSTSTALSLCRKSVLTPGSRATMPTVLDPLMPAIRTD